MASATGIPDRSRGIEDAPGESQPLLGQPGDVIQKPDESVFHNLISGTYIFPPPPATSFPLLPLHTRPLPKETKKTSDRHFHKVLNHLPPYSGTGWLAQGGAVLLVALVWSSVFSNPPFIPLFSPHPLLQSAGVLAVTEAILILQPTWTASEKVVGARYHAALNLLSFALFTAGIVIIEANKFKQGPGSHFHSVHGYLGVVTGVVLLLQYAVGFLMWGVPGVFGGVEKAKAVWKYHRMNGYLLLLLILATVISAVYTDFNVNVLDIKLWALCVAIALIVLGVYPRLHPRKLGFEIGRQQE